MNNKQLSTSLIEGTSLDIGDRVIVVDDTWSPNFPKGKEGVVLSKSIRKSIEGYQQVLVRFDGEDEFTHAHVPINVLEKITITNSVDQTKVDDVLEKLDDLAKAMKDKGNDEAANLFWKSVDMVKEVKSKM